jgi:RNA polymerase sigma-70 factor (ECF subfamily)
MSASALEPTDAPRALDPDRLAGYIGPLYRAAWALCGSRHDAEDLVQETFAQVLQRPRWMRSHNEIGYLMRALRNTYASRYRTASARRVLPAALHEAVDVALTV